MKGIVMDKFYVVVGTDYCGPIYCFEYSDVPTVGIADCCEKACWSAFTAYEGIVENSDVPAGVLYRSVKILAASSYLPDQSWDVYIKA